MSDVKTGSSTYSIDKLTESNYRSWAQQMEWILDEKDLWEVVNGTVKEPTIQQVSSAEGTSAQTAKECEELEKSVQDFKAKAKKVRSTIGSSILVSVMVYIEGMTDAAETWKTLEQKYNPKTKTTLLQAIRQFMTVKMMDGVLEKHLQWVQCLKHQCEEQGETILDTIYNRILLNSVPEEFKIEVSILESQD